jgi:hypothetical protein
VRQSEARLQLPETMDGRGEEKLARTAKELAMRESSGGAASQNDCGGAVARERCGGAWTGCGSAQDGEEARLRGHETARRHGCAGARR